jgi:hypothetical protein
MEELEQPTFWQLLAGHRVLRHDVLQIPSGIEWQEAARQRGSSGSRQDIQVNDFAITSFVLHDGRVQDADDVRVPESSIRFDLAHGKLDAFVARSDEYLLEGIQPLRGRVLDEIYKRKA